MNINMNRNINTKMNISLDHSCYIDRALAVLATIVHRCGKCAPHFLPGRNVS
jgi:hypothetical protein